MVIHRMNQDSLIIILVLHFISIQGNQDEVKIIEQLKDEFQLSDEVRIQYFGVKGVKSIKKKNKLIEEDAIRLEDYHVTEKYAFLLENPLCTLPEYFHPWMILAKKIEQLIENEKIRDEIHKMPLLDHTRLSGHKEWRLAQVVLSCLTQAYVWVMGEDGIPKVLPKQLAIPFAGVSEYLGVPPSISNMSFGLANYKLKDCSGPVELENLEAIITITGGTHSNWFFMVYVAVELECGPGIKAILDAQQAVHVDNPERLMVALTTIESSLTRMTKVLSRMHEQCDPEVFYNELRPFLSGWDGAAFKNKGLQGLIYEGVSEEPKQFVGGSAAQSSIIPCFDAALGVHPTHSEKTLIDKFREYMPPVHREFIAAIGRGPSIASYVAESGDKALRSMYNRCISALQQFRSCHIQLAARYIVVMSSKQKQNKLHKFGNQGLSGTGGTGFMKFLKNLRDTTKQSALPDVC